MHVDNAILMRAPARRVYDLAADVERWPALLPHYRWVRVLERDGNTRLVEMACWRDLIPLRWRAVLEIFPDRPELRFRHVAGVTRGMAVAWTFTPDPAGTIVRIAHDLRLPWPLVGPAAADWVIGPLFVSNVAGKTLRRFRDLAEGRAHA